MLYRKHFFLFLFLFLQWLKTKSPTAVLLSNIQDESFTFQFRQLKPGDVTSAKAVQPTYRIQHKVR